jgi:branched-chain amino acid transport system substrate-binding protein
MKAKTSWLGAVGGAFLFVLAGGVVFAAATPASAAGPAIVIGATSSETGPFAADADYNLNGMKLGVAEVNARGGWLGRKIELRVYDDKSNAGTGVLLYTRLITKDRAQLLLGPYSSAITQAVAPLFEKYRFAVIEPEASLPDIYVAGNHWNFQGGTPSTGYLDALLPIAKKAGAKTAAVVALKSAFSLACYRYRIAQAKKLGMKVVYQDTYSLPQSNWGAIALAIKNAHPDVVIGCTYFPDAVGITMALHNQGFAPRYLAETVGPVEASFIKATGPLANGVISNTGWWFNFKTRGNGAFIAHYEAMFHQKPDYHAAEGYSAVEELGAAVKATHSLDQAKIADWWRHHTLRTVVGTFKVDANGLQLGYKQDMVQIQNGVIKMVWPSHLAQTKLIVPYPGS